MIDIQQWQFPHLTMQIFQELNEITQSVIDLTYEQLSSSEQFDDNTAFGVAVDILFPEVHLQYSRKVYAYCHEICFLHVCIQSLMDSDKLTYEQAINMYVIESINL